MTTVGQIQAGSVLTAGMAQSVAPLSAYKSSNQSVTSSTTLVDDSALYVPLLASAVYFFTCVLGYEGGTRGSSDIKVAWSLPTDASMVYALTGYTTGGDATAGYWETESASPTGTNGSTTPISAVLNGTVTMSSTAGNMQLQWAQNTSSSTATTVLAGSVLVAWQVQ